MLNAVLFDLDNTLVDRNLAFRECVRAHFQDPGVRAELLRLDCGGRGNRQALFNYWELQAAMPMDQTILGQLLAARLRPNLALLQSLRALSNWMKLAIITNGGSDSQRRKYHAAQLERVIPPARLVISSEVGYAKPDRAIFLLACEMLGEAPANCLYIGDDERNDFAGAKAAGMRACLAGTALCAEQLNAVLTQELAG